MTEEEIEKTLESQLKLLAKCSEKAPDSMLIEMSHQMLLLSTFLIRCKRRRKTDNAKNGSAGNVN